MLNSCPRSHDITGYYWRDFTGRIPEDAVPGGWTVNRNATYIGQVFSGPWGGVFTATIYPHKPDVEFGYKGSKKSDGFVQILCSTQTKLFRWIPVNHKEFQLQTIGYNLVRGGQEYGKWLNIGRIEYQGEVVTGKVCSGNIGNAELWFAFNGSEFCSKNYEVLIFEG